MVPPALSVSVVIPTWNRPDFLPQLTMSILEGSYRRVSVVVVDQSDDDRTGKILAPLAARHQNLSYVHTTRRGVTRAYNAAARQTSAEVLAFIDDDCVAAPDWVEKVVTCLQSDPDAGLVYGQVLAPRSWETAPPFLPQLHIAAPERISRGEGFRVVGMNANSAVRRSVYERVGGFDELLGPGAALKGAGQDFDFQYRVCLVGSTVLLSPELKVEHFGVRSSEEWAASLLAYGRGDGAFYFKHVRCGDPLAVRLLGSLLAKLLLRQVLQPIRRKDSRTVYLRGLLGGIRDSLRYPIDRVHRLYLTPDGGR